MGGIDKEEHIKRIKAGLEETNSHVGRVPTGYEIEDGQLVPGDKYDDVTAFIQEVNRGRPKKPTARDFGINPNTAQSILENSDRYWDAEYVGDEEWRRRRAEVKNSER